MVPSIIKIHFDRSRNYKVIEWFDVANERETLCTGGGRNDPKKDRVGMLCV